MKNNIYAKMATFSLLCLFLPSMTLAASVSPLKGMKVVAVGNIAKADILKLPIADFNLSYGKDADGDGISNEAQRALGLGLANAKNKKLRKNNLLRSMRPDDGKKMPIDKKLAASKKGYLLMEDVGGTNYEWFVSSNGKAYFLGNSANNAEFLKTIGLIMPKPATDKTATDKTATAINGVAFTEVAGGLYQGASIERALGYVATESELNRLWLTLYPSTVARPAEPKVDFTKDRLVVVIGSHDGYSVGFKSVGLDGSVKAGIESQSASCPFAASQAFKIIKFAKGDLRSQGVSSLDVAYTDTKKCRPATPDVGSPIYTNKDYGFSVKLPDPVSAFKINTLSATATGPEFTRIEFSRYSASRGKDIVAFRIYVIPNAKWPDINKKGYVELDDEFNFMNDRVTKITADASNTYAYGEYHSLTVHDVGDYFSFKIVPAQF